MHRLRGEPPVHAPNKGTSTDTREHMCVQVHCSACACVSGIVLIEKEPRCSISANNDWPIPGAAGEHDFLADPERGGGIFEDSWG
eukprot:scaffold122244_cov17-Tisochrysis_lutea.AAC.2